MTSAGDTRLKQQIKNNDNDERNTHQPHQNPSHNLISLLARRIWNHHARLSFPRCTSLQDSVEATSWRAVRTSQLRKLKKWQLLRPRVGRPTGAPLSAGRSALSPSRSYSFTAGSGFGLSTLEPWSFANRAPETFAVGAAIWLVVMQWLSAAFGGYLAGRLRAKWIGPRTDEVLFRDTAHGLLAWALATVIVAALFTLGTLGTSAAVVATEGAPAADAAATLTEEARKAAANFSIVTAISL
jgi:hypothetical protein